MSQQQPLRPQDDASQNMAPRDAPTVQFATITNDKEGSVHVISGTIGGQVNEGESNMSPVGGSKESDTITIGEALEATALSEAGDKPVEKSDAAAIQAAEVRATGSSQIIPGGIAAAAQSAATLNSKTKDDANKTTLGDVLADASLKLPEDQPVKAEDAERVIGAEIRNDPELAVHPGGVSSSLATAAKLNQKLK